LLTTKTRLLAGFFMLVVPVAASSSQDRNCTAFWMIHSGGLAMPISQKKKPAGGRV